MWSHIQKVVHDWGHILLCSPKGHCEPAGVGIEYCSGKSKQHFVREYNDCKTANLHINIEASLAPSNLSLNRVRSFARKTREYKRAYAGMDALLCESSKSVKTCRSHRSARDLHLGFLKRS